MTPSREKVREHNVLLSPLVPPPQGKNISRRTRQGSMIPTVLIESRSQREDRKRRTKGWRAFCRRYGPSMCMLVGVFFLMDKMDDWFSLEKWIDVYPISIQRDYSTVQGIEDLTTDNVDRWCHVSCSQQKRKKWCLRRPPFISSYALL